MSDFLLKVGSIDLSEGVQQAGDFTFYVYGLSRGKPAPVTETVPSLLVDGALERRVRDENRDLALLVSIDGPDGSALAAGEAVLLGEYRRERTTLSWAGPDGFGATSVFEVLWSDLALVEDDGWDLDEPGVLRPEGKRFYRWSFRCAPYARSVDPVTESFTPGTASYTSVNAATSLTGWSSGYTLTVVSHDSENSIRVVGPGDSGLIDNTITVRLTQAISAGPPYLVLDLRHDDGGPNQIAMRASNGNTYNPVGYDGDRIFFPHPGAVSWVEWLIRVGISEWTGYIHEVESATNLPSTSLFVLSPQGSVRAPCSLHVGGAGLGDSFVFTDPLMLSSGYQPKSSATWSALPEGAYQLWGKPSSAPAVGDVLSATAFGDQTVAVRAEYADQRWVPLGVVYAKPTRSGRVSPSSVTADASSTASSSMSGNFMLFRTGDGAHLTHALLTTENHLWIESPSLSRPRGGLYAGTSSDGTAAAALTGAVSERAVHMIEPPLTAVFVHCADETAPTLDADYFPHWHTHAGQ